MRKEFNGIYNGLTVLITGHTGFKGSWLAIWLKELGARVIGYSLKPPTKPSNFAASHLDKKMIHIEGDILDFEHFKQVIAQYQPAIIFHLAAQAIVLDSYSHPKTTFETNVQGSVNIFEAARHAAELQALIMVTTDKCYENREWVWGYRETDPLGGNDPYSASKAMAELAIASYRKSFFADRGPAIASARAGNVIGGGDFASYRLLPDSMKALMAHEPIIVRNPDSVRPWFHVLDALSGYLWLGACLLHKNYSYAQPWNLGPKEQRGVPVKDLVEKAIALWGTGTWESTSKLQSETHRLRLNWDKAAHDLEWEPTYHWEEAVEETVDWFKAYLSSRDMYSTCAAHIEDYVSKALQTGIKWACPHHREIKCGL